MLNFCTLFNSYYFSRGIALYNSLIREEPNATLYIVTFDDIAYDALVDLKLSNAVIIALNEFEDEKLLEIKETRSVGEYCWTCTPSVIKYCLDKYNLDYCTYLDADLYFFKSPQVLLDELTQKDADVLITEHRYTSTYDQTENSGKYCVQFMTFRNNTNGNMILNWWRDSCIDWCYAYCEDGKFGDQKYLDDWMTRFDNVIELQHLGGGVAPWNVQQYKIEKEHDQVNLCDIDGNQLPVVFYHFHNLKLYHNREPFFGWYKLDSGTKDHLYAPYLEELLCAESEELTFDPHGKSTYEFSFMDVLRKVKYSLKNLVV
jgi:hypothetical protein